MRDILPQIKTVAGVCGRQPATSEPRRLSRYCLRVPVPEGELLHHTLTGEVVLLSHEEAAAMLEGGDVRDELVARWYLVPQDFDEYGFAQQVRKVARLLVREGKGITGFVIFTTLHCNARCPYCYERGRPQRSMTDQIAHDVAAFIMRQCEGNDVRLNWFGGEPLVNRRAIDIIVDDLTAAGIGITSQMTSNGYLFDEGLVRHAREVWKLGSVQITLDGTEDVYNRTKAYVGIEGSAYERVLANIDLLVDAGMKVSIRLNMSVENAQDLWQLSDELAERFVGKEGVHAYVAPVRDYTSDGCVLADSGQALAAYAALQQHLDEIGIGSLDQPKNKHAENHCMADNDRWLTVLPDGRLGKCEHESEERLVGSIYQAELDDAMLGEWKRTVQVPACRTCLFYPQCVRLALCPSNADDCTEDDRNWMLQDLTNQVKNALLAHRGDCPS